MNRAAIFLFRDIPTYSHPTGVSNDKAVKIAIVMSIFNPTLLPTEDSIPSYGNEQIKILTNFYGKEAEVQYAGISYTSPPLLNGDELLSEWKIFGCALWRKKLHV